MAELWPCGGQVGSGQWSVVSGPSSGDTGATISRGKAWTGVSRGRAADRRAELAPSLRDTEGEIGRYLLVSLSLLCQK